MQWDSHQHYATVLFQCSRCVYGEYQQVSQQLLAQFKQPDLWTPEPEPEKPPAPEPEKVIEGSVIGYRAWRIKDWMLTGTGVNRAWHPGVNEATCDTGDMGVMFPTVGERHPAPAVGCHCGITALARFADQDEHWGAGAIPGAIEAWSDETVDIPQPGDVAEAAGVLTADAIAEMYEVPPEYVRPKPDPVHAGRFILHGTGFRAQYGKVVLLAVDEEWPTAKRAAVRALAAEHGADVCKRSHLEDAAKEHGQLVPDEMLEWAKEGEPEAESPYGPYLTQAMQTISGSFNVPMGYLTSRYIPRGNAQIYTWSSSIPYMPGARPKPKPTRKGISQTLGYPGPPSHGKFRRGDRVRDRTGEIWQCQRGGNPGVWEQEEAAE
jgi:hypothetical protein